MHEDDFQAVCRYPEVERERSLLALADACTGLEERPAASLETVAEHVTRLCLDFGWRLASLSADAPPQPQEDGPPIDRLQRAIGTLIRTELAQRGDADALFGPLREVSRATLDVLRARRLERGALLERCAARFRGIAPLAPWWRPPPVRPPGPALAFELRFGPHLLAIRDTSVSVDAETVDLGHHEVAIAAFEANARGFEREGLRASSHHGADLLGILDVFAYFDPPATRIWLQGERVVEAHIAEDDPVGFFDGLAPAARRAARGIGAFCPSDPVPPGVVGIHLLRRLFAHPAAHHDALQLSLSLDNGFIDPVLDWLAATPRADRLTALELTVPVTDQYVPIRAEARPLGALFPSLRSLTVTYRSWPLWSAAPFPKLESLTLVGVSSTSQGPDWRPPVAEVTADLATKAPALTRFTIAATRDALR